MSIFYLFFLMSLYKFNKTLMLDSIYHMKTLKILPYLFCHIYVTLLWPSFHNITKAKKKIMCGSGYRTYPKFLPPILNIFHQILKWEENSRTNNFVLLFSSNFRIWRKNTYQNDHLKLKSKFLCIQSLVLEVKGLKQGYVFKNIPLYQFCLI